MTLEALALDADVLIVGGGLAGGWSAIAAASAGASVILVEKGWFGTSGVAATAGPGHWWVPPNPVEARQEAVRQRNQRAFGLGDPEWMERILDQTWRTLPLLAAYYNFSKDENGVTQYRGLRGPEYLRALRRFATALGVRILDHSPALELMADPDGVICGARGWQSQGDREWIVRAGAVVLATGGCAFRSRLLGSQNNTGDGLLMAAEAGADLSGMEFSSYYTVSPARSTMTRSMSYAFARYFDADGRELDIPPAGPESTRALAAALLVSPVFCSLERTPADIRNVMPQVQPNFMLPFDRWGIDPYRQRFEVILRGEGTVRGVGGLRIADKHCGVGVPGLYAAGDVASREPVAGATSGGGAQNSAWALSTGHWAGGAAARFARRRGRIASAAEPLGRAGLRPSASQQDIDCRAVDAVVRGEMLPYDKNFFRSGDTLGRSLRVLDALWREVGEHAGGKGRQRLRAREAASLIAAGRWCYAAAQARAESRGMHQRIDAPKTDLRLARRLRVRGLDRVLIHMDTAQAASEAA